MKSNESTRSDYHDESYDFTHFDWDNVVLRFYPDADYTELKLMGAFEN